VHAAGRPGGSPGRRALAVILAIIGFLAIIAGILYLAGAANSLHFMVGSVHKGHHLIRAGVSFVAGAGLLAGAWFAARAGGELPPLTQAHALARGRCGSRPPDSQALAADAPTPCRRPPACARGMTYRRASG
jgi:hypothetical protein